MTVYSALASFAVIAGLLTIIPGLDTAVVVRAAVSYGRAAGFVTALGVGTGTLVWGAAAAIGVSALLTASRTGYEALRLAGAAYLIGLGAAMLWQRRRRGATTAAPGASGNPELGEATATATAGDPVPDRGMRAAAGDSPQAVQPVRPARPRLLLMWSRGVLTNLLNPKVGVFYVAMLPQFIPAGSQHLLMGLALAGVHDAEDLIWFTMLITAAHRARRWLTSDRVRRGMDRLTGTVLIAFGLKLVFARS